jgi:hypothetical protein
MLFPVWSGKRAMKLRDTQQQLRKMPMIADIPELL